MTVITLLLALILFAIAPDLVIGLIKLAFCIGVIGLVGFIGLIIFI
mgnify:CR=1 FL=1